MIPQIPVSWIIYGAIALGVGGYIIHCQYTKTELREARAAAERQLQENAERADQDKKAKERSDANYQRNIARLNADLKRLRDARASLLPAPAPGAEHPERACFDRTQLDAALRGYREGVLGLLGEGAAAVEGLDEARVWAQGRH